jgi:hypothetical protein
LPVHDEQITYQSVIDEVRSNLYESGLRRHTLLNLTDGIVDAFNYCNAELTPTVRSILIPKLDTPYYNLAEAIPDYMYLYGIFNCTTNRWLEPLPSLLYKRDRLNFFMVGEPQFFNVVDLRRVTIWPYPSAPVGAFFIVYKAFPLLFELAQTPELPHSIGSQYLEYFTTAEMLEQDREFTKALLYWNKIHAKKGTTPSLYDQLKREISNLARYDIDNVLEPYRWLFHGGGSSTMWISNETPSGNVDGSNYTFTLQGVPNPTSSLILQVNGQTLFQNVAYTLSGQTVTIAGEYIPQTGDYIRCWYQV